MPMASGTMYKTAARLAAIWWLAKATAPSRAMNKAIKVNEVTSTMMDKPAGTPKAQKAAKSRANGVFRAGRHKLVGLVDVLCAQAATRPASSIKCVDQRAWPRRIPPRPCLTIWRPAKSTPNVKAYDSGILTSKAPACSQVTKRGKSQTLVERAVHAKQQGRQQGQRQHAQIGTHIGPEILRGTSVQPTATGLRKPQTVQMPMHWRQHQQM
jgi:hypothetical protein